MPLILQLTIAIITIVVHGKSATYYVATTGSDSNPGTAAAPLRTLQQGVRLAQPGDTILVRDGRYGAEGADTSSMPVNIASAGTPSAWITLKAEHKGGAVLDCQLRCHSYVSFRDGAAYWVLQDFEITGGLWGGVWANSSAHDLQLQGNEIDHIGNLATNTSYGIVGFYSSSAVHHVTIAGNVFHDIGRTNSNIPNHDHGLYLQGGSEYTVINNVFYNLFRGWGVQLSHNPVNVLIANNTFAFANPYRSGQIVFDSGSTGAIIRNNLFYQPAGLAVTNAGGSNPGCSIDHNLVYGPRVITDASECATSANLLTDPRLVNPSTPPYDFHLQAGSPAIAAALPLAAVSTDFDGTPRPKRAAYAIGAYEHRTCLFGKLACAPS